MNWIKGIIATFFSFLIFFSNNIIASPWQFEIAPYLWAINMNGRVQVGPLKSHVSENFGDILRQFQGGGMVYLDAHKDNVGLFLNILYTVLEQTNPIGPVTATAKNKFGLFSAGGSYDIYKKCFGNALDPSQITLSPYIGFRYTLNNTKVTINNFNLSATENKNWIDPIIGAKILYNVNKNWLAILAGDVGGTNLNDHNSYNVQGYIGYKPTRSPCLTVYGGYRLLYQHYVTGSGLTKYDWTMKLFGPVIGLSFGF